MLPGAYYLPVAVLLIVGGFIACFLGYRLFKFVLAMFGFILGALAASSVFGVSDTTPMVIAALIGGLVGALLLLAAYFVGVALVGAGLGALVANLIWTQIERDPHPFVIVLFSVAGALVATWLQRYVIILGTAFGGAWTIIVGALAVMGDKTALGAVRVDCARPRRHRRADVRHRRSERPRRQVKQKEDAAVRISCHAATRRPSHAST